MLLLKVRYTSGVWNNVCGYICDTTYVCCVFSVILILEYSLLKTETSKLRRSINCLTPKAMADLLENEQRPHFTSFCLLKSHALFFDLVTSKSIGILEDLRLCFV